MIHTYIARMYESGQDDEARRAIAAEITRANTPEGEQPTYTPTESEIDAVETEYYAARRKYRYGSWDAQLEEQYDDYSAWESRIAVVKAGVPKP